MTSLINLPSTTRPQQRYLRTRIIAAAAAGALALLTSMAPPSEAAPSHTTSSPAAASPTTVPQSVPQSVPTMVNRNGAPYVEVRTERYGSDPLQYVTVMRSSVSIGPRPTAYFVHGGSWVMGSPVRWSHEAKVWAARGWTVVNVSYRLGVDGRLMLADLKTVTDTYRLKPYVNRQRQILVGDSAGGHLATLLAAHYPSRFRGVIAWSPVISPAVAVTDGLAPGANAETVLLGKRAAALWGYSAETTTALSYVNARTPPLWVAASASEWLSYSDQGATLCAALGSRCRSVVVDGTEHGTQIATAHPALADMALAWAESISRISK